jgi:hypothetical protein
MITILNPRVGGVERNLRLNSPPLDLNGKTVGFLDNGKKNFDVYLDRTEELLRESFTFNAFRRRKALPIKGITPELFEELVESCDVVITGSGD